MAMRFLHLPLHGFGDALVQGAELAPALITAI
jgi:hypothetical protein